MVSTGATSSRWFFTVAVVNVLIIAASFSVFGWNEVGAGVATRNTARFAIVFFLAGFAAPGARRWFTWWPEPALLLQTFVVAQLVHFGAVALLHTKFSATEMRLGAGQIAIVIVGFAIVAGVGATAHAAAGRGYKRVAHLVLVYLVFLILAADYSQHPVKMLRWMTLPVVLALVLRHLPRKKPTPQKSREAAAG
jgi:hypothetical protein